MQYLNQANETWRASVLIVIYFHFKFHEIQFMGYLVIANYMDFKSGAIIHELPKPA